MAESESFDALLKVVMVGDSNVGKTNLVLRYTKDIFRENVMNTVGKRWGGGGGGGVAKRLPSLIWLVLRPAWLQVWTLRRR